MGPSNEKVFLLPLAVVSVVDLGRLLRGLRDLDENLRQEVLRKGTQELALPRTSKLLEELALNNKIDLLNESQRQHLLSFMTELKDHAPVLHISFAADPSPAFLFKVMTWLRQEIHPLILLQIGLQPSIAAGCIVRSTDKYFDFSLRKHFVDKRNLLIELIGAKT